MFAQLHCHSPAANQYLMEQPTTSTQHRKPPSSSKGKARETIVVEDDDQDADPSPKQQQTANGKGKRKAAPPDSQTSKKARATPDVSTDADVVEMEGKAPQGQRQSTQPASKKPPPLKKLQPNGAGAMTLEAAERIIARLEKDREDDEREMAKLQRHSERLQKENTRVSPPPLIPDVPLTNLDMLQLLEERDTYAQQFEDLSKLRITEPERSIEDLIEITNNRAEKQQAMIDTLTEQLTEMDALSRDGQTHGLKLLTREATDARFVDMRTQLAKKDEALTKMREESSGLTERGKGIGFRLRCLFTDGRLLLSPNPRIRLEARTNHDGPRARPSTNSSTN